MGEKPAVRNCTGGAGKSEVAVGSFASATVIAGEALEQQKQSGTQNAAQASDWFDSSADMVGFGGKTSSEQQDLSPRSSTISARTKSTTALATVLHRSIPKAPFSMDSSNSRPLR